MRRADHTDEQLIAAANIRKAIPITAIGSLDEITASGRVALNRLLLEPPTLHTGSCAKCRGRNPNRYGANGHPFCPTCQ